MDLSNVNFDEEDVEKFLKGIVNKQFLQNIDEISENNKNHEVTYGALYKIDETKGLPNVLDLFTDEVSEKVANMILDLDKPVINIKKIAELSGCKIVPIADDEYNQLGFEPDGNILVDQSSYPSASRFTIARELVRNIIPKQADVNDYEMTLTAEFYARELIAPQSLILMLLKNKEFDGRTMADLGDKIQVSYPIVKWQYAGIG